MKKQPAKATATPLEIYCKQFSDTFAPGASRALQIVAGFLFQLGLLSLFWSFPFPHLNWLGKYNGYINWGAILMTALVYYYYRLSQVTSYLMLLVIFAFTYLISQALAYEKNGGMGLAITSIGVLAVALMFWFISYKKSNKVQMVAGYFTLLLIAPVWALQAAFPKLKGR